MRLAIIGNMNNNANNLIRYLVDRGLDCTLCFYQNEASHFVPDADNIEGISYPHVNLEWGSYPGLFLTPTSRIRKDLDGFDFLIGSRLAPSYLLKAGRTLDLFMPTGGDIWTVPVFVDFQVKNLTKFLFYSKIQKTGIKRASALFFDRTNSETEDKIHPVIQGLKRLEYPIPCLYHPDYEGARLERRIELSEYHSTFQSLRSASDLLLVHHVKHLWRTESVQAFDILQEKGNDRIFHALKRFRIQYPNIKVKMLTFEYGPDHYHSRQLAVDLGVDDMVHWFPRLKRKELMIAISMADAVIGEIARSWFSYGTILESMAMNKPVIHHRNDAYFSGRELYPMLNANNADSIFDALSLVFQQPEMARAIGKGGGDWLRKTVGFAIDDICQLIEEKEKSSWLRKN